ncbi:hypothetical protein DB347_18165 [Opitutaceae bacterium EW11]|nr:hypothetical protein DB347_18165 [Opitutaceae bacterium EW11]
MSSAQFFAQAWGGGPVLPAACAGATLVYWLRFRRRARWPYFLAAVGVVLLALASPIAALAAGALFSAHMVQHLFLLLAAPALLLLSLPGETTLPRSAGVLSHPLLTWSLGVAPMWIWHVPALCDAATVRPSIKAVQVVSMLAMGALFWWPILAPRARDRLQPLLGVVYLFAACLGCTALGMILTLTPVEVCTVFRNPVAPAATASLVRDTWGVSAETDRQIGGLLMWVPMCLVYVAAILVELRRWFGDHELEPARIAPEVRR